ncbi:unnamed protein product [Alopecurus aequalis]
MSGHWSDGETWALIQAWGELYLGRKGGSLRVSDWHQVCNAVNAHPAAAGRRGIAQCKWRLSNLKAQYKKELAKGQPPPGWRNFAQLRAFLASPDGGPPPGFAAKMPPALVNEEASGSTGRKTVPAKRRFSSLQDILDPSGGPAPGFPPSMPATAKEEVKEEEAESEGPAHGAASARCCPAAVVMMLAEVYRRVEMEKLSVEKEKMAMERAAKMEAENGETYDTYLLF